MKSKKNYWTPEERETKDDFEIEEIIPENLKITINKKQLEILKFHLEQANKIIEYLGEK